MNIGIRIGIGIEKTYLKDDSDRDSNPDTDQTQSI